jgi:hypothetical protein
MPHSEDFIGKTYFCPRKYELSAFPVKGVTFPETLHTDRFACACYGTQADGTLG